MQGGNSLAVQRLGLRTFIAKGPGSIPGWGTKIPQAARCGQKNPRKQKTRARNVSRVSGSQDQAKPQPVGSHPVCPPVALQGKRVQLVQVQAEGKLMGG